MDEKGFIKLADFGLAKKFYDNYKYDKTSRMSVPWKWMALELLKDDYLMLASDVWSYAVLVWEMLSFGKMPYGHQSYKEVFKKLNRGYRLPFPQIGEYNLAWSPEAMYDKLSSACFIADPKKRATFSDVVKITSRSSLPEQRASILF